MSSFVQPTGQKGLILDFGRSRPPDYCLIIFKVNLWYRFRVNGDFISRALKVGSRRLVKHHLRENSPSMASEAIRAPRYTVRIFLSPRNLIHFLSETKIEHKLRLSNQLNQKCTVKPKWKANSA